MKFYGSLKAELDKAKEDLKEVEENIKKIIGRDPNEGPPNRYLLFYSKIIFKENGERFRI